MPQPDGSWRTQPRPPGWHRTRRRILTRDNHQCQWPTGQLICGAYANQVDHIIQPIHGGTDEDENLRALCYGHHKTKSSSEGGKAKAANRIPKRRPPERHPGLIA